MIKLAIFVEGYTELIFVDKFIKESLGANHVAIDHHSIRGGSTTKRTVAIMLAHSPTTAAKYYFLIYDCGGDALVKTRILEEHQNLTDKGYSKIIGIRDLRPDFLRTDLPRLEAGLKMYIKTSLIPVEFILAVMEIEAWFLAEFTHYTKISPKITLDAVKHLGFDPENEDLSMRQEPANDLDAIYKIGGESYQKSNIVRTVEALDFEKIYLELTDKIPSLKKLKDNIDSLVG